MQYTNISVLFSPSYLLLFALQRAALEDALRQLYVLDAIDIDGRITSIGKSMAKFPLDPCLARALLAAQDLGCLDAMLSVASMLSPEGSVFLGGKGPEQLVNGVEDNRPHRPGDNINNKQPGSKNSSSISHHGKVLLSEMMSDGLGDHVLLLRIWEGWQSTGTSSDWCRDLGIDLRAMRFARDVRKQLAQIIVPTTAEDERKEKEKINSDFEKDRSAKRARTNTTYPLKDEFSDSKTIKSLRKALTIGFASRLARRMPMHNGYRTLGESSALAQIHPSAARLSSNEDGLLPEWVVFHELISTGRVYLSGVCAVEGNWVAEVLPKLQKVDIARLSGGVTGEKAKAAQEERIEDKTEEGAISKGRRNDETAVDAARARFLARKAAAGGGKSFKR